MQVRGSWAGIQRANMVLAPSTKANPYTSLKKTGMCGLIVMRRGDKRMRGNEERRSKTWTDWRQRREKRIK